MNLVGSFCRLKESSQLSPAALAGQSALILSGLDDYSNVEVVLTGNDGDTPNAMELNEEDYSTEVLPSRTFARSDRIFHVPLDALELMTASAKPNFVAEVRKRFILNEAAKFSRQVHSSNRPGNDPMRSPFVPGVSSVPYAGRVFTEAEVQAAVSSTLDFWLTLGPEGQAFEEALAHILGVRHSLLVNSGSSANLVALSALTSHKLPSERRIQAGDEVITVAAGFPTTVAPILQNGAVPVFLDNDPSTGNIRADLLEAAYVEGRTKAVMIAHTLGNPFDLQAVLAFCKKYDLWLIEDNCDALGSTYTMPIQAAVNLGLLEWDVVANSIKTPKNLGALAQVDLHAGTFTAPTGSFGDISTQSFYPPHHLTMGEGGAVNIVRRPPLKTYAESFRDWGRDCWCPSGKDNTCGKRFGWQLGELPEGYDHKYIYSHLGYNLKPLDPQAAIGRAQLKKLPAFTTARKENWNMLRSGLAGLGEYFDFSVPTHAVRLEASDSPGPEWKWDSTGCSTAPSWFGFMLRVRSSAPFTHTQLGKFLDERKIGNRMLFGGNLLRQPVFVELRRNRPASFRVVDTDGTSIPFQALQDRLAKSSPLPGADQIMNSALFLGTYPGLSERMIEFEIESIKEFVALHSG